MITWKCIGKTPGYDCQNAATGVGAPGGLRAIGWHVRYDLYGAEILCPACRPEGTHENSGRTLHDPTDPTICTSDECSYSECIGRREAKRIQSRFMPGEPGRVPAPDAPLPIR